jgi:hypothetical protein
VFGIEYEIGAAKAYRFFALEADRGTMPIARTRPGQTSYLGKLSAYRRVIEEQAHRTQWGIPNLLVLTLTSSAARATEIVAKLGSDATPAFLFKAADERTLARPVRDLLTVPWTRANLPPLSIAEAR